MKIKCPNCSGIGVVMKIKCPNCDGEGIVEFDLGYPGHSEATEPMIDIRPCPKCNGRGEVEPPPCPRCGGDGEIYYTEWCEGVGYPVVDKCPVCFGSGVALEAGVKLEVPR